MLVEWIKEALVSGRQPPRDRLGLSAAGKCERQLAYQAHQAKGIPLSWKSLSIFLDGDLYHDQIRSLLHAADKPACFYLASEEEEVRLITPGGKEIIGHVDGVIHHDPQLGEKACNDSSHCSYLLEVKSMSSTGYRMLGREGLEKSYIAQVSCYLKALDLQKCLVVCKCKDTSELTELLIERDDKLVADCLAKFDRVLDAKVPDSVQRSYGPTENGSLPWNCGYCPYWQTCWKDYDPVEPLPHKLKLHGDYKNA
jgi:hypothetical protein